MKIFLTLLIIISGLFHQDVIKKDDFKILDYIKPRNNQFLEKYHLKNSDSITASIIAVKLNDGDTIEIFVRNSIKQKSSIKQNIYDHISNGKYFNKSLNYSCFEVDKSIYYFLEK